MEPCDAVRCGVKAFQSTRPVAEGPNSAEPELNRSSVGMGENGGAED